MEVVIPVLLFGGAYVLSNSGNDEKDAPVGSAPAGGYASAVAGLEGFQPNNRTVPSVSRNALPNTTIPPQNYPVVGAQGMLDLKTQPDHFPAPNAPVDKIFNSAVWENKAVEASMAPGASTYMSLTGNAATAADFSHQNMVPFFGSRVRQRTNIDGNESILDNIQGAGSQFIHKQEQAPLFKPQENYQWAFGTPNQTDFIQSRMNPSMKMSNVKPWQEIRVGPGLNSPDGVVGTGGFNAGMQARDRWIDKTVDELRVATNPKVSYEGVILAGKNPVTNRGIVGAVEKNRPDTYWINSPDRYFTTTGQEKAQMARGVELLRPENRTTTTREYFGNAGEGETQATYIPGQYMPSMRPELTPFSEHITNAHAAGKHDSNEGDHGRFGYMDSVIQNNRSITGVRQPQMGGLFSFMRAAIAPFMDVMRPSRKENVIGNLRETGNAAAFEAAAGPVYNPADRTRTTIREMTENNPFQMNVGSSEFQGYGYVANPQQPVSQQRDDTLVGYVGNSGNTAGTANAMTYDSAYNAQMIDKEPISRGRAPMGSNVKMFNGQAFQNIHIDKMDADRQNNRMFVPQVISAASPAQEMIGQRTSRSEWGQDVYNTRNTPEILNAFRSNPYAHSLHSVA